MSNFVQWIQEVDLFLFDCDGLLVDTEYLHYQAYKKMCSDRGFILTWDFLTYCSMAHMGADLFQKKLYNFFPALYKQEPNWAVLHQEKQRAILDILSREGVSLMPGVKRVLEFLQSHGARCVVVTHSPSELTDAIKKHHPVLQAIPHWVTREDYDKPKPAPDSYLKAIELYAKQKDRVLGFEDTIRGWRALKLASVQAVVVSSVLTEEMKKELQEEGAEQYASFENLIV
jgi:beta-phosphoglucomutase